MEHVYLITEDPGIRGAGIAVFHQADKKLIAASYAKSLLKSGHMAEECRAVAMTMIAWLNSLGIRSEKMVSQLGVEWPLLLPAGQQKGDQNDLPPLAGVSAAFAIMFPTTPCRSFIPREWKGTVEPDVMTRRIHARLTPEELGVVTWTGKEHDPLVGLNHNTFDAIGIGLHMLGRLQRQRVYAGV